MPVTLPSSIGVPIPPEGSSGHLAKHGDIDVGLLALAAFTPGVVFTQTTAAATWTIPHTFGRVPNVEIVVGGRVMDTDVMPDVASVTVMFAVPAAGLAILT